MKQIISIIFFVMFVMIVSQAQVIVFENLEQPISEKDSLKIDRIIRYQKDFYSQIVPIDSVQLKLRLFANKEAYRAYIHSHKVSGLSLKHSGGMYITKTKELLVPKVKERSFLNVVYHEMSHHLLREILLEPPKWLDEGLAKYFEHIQIGKNKITHKMEGNEIGHIKSLLEMKEINLKEFISSKGKDFFKESVTNENYSYKVAHAIVYFLIINDSAQFKQMIIAIKNGTPSYDAINTTYTGGFSQFETDFVAYFR